MFKTKKGEINVANDKGQEKDKMTEKIIVERKYTNEITHIQAVLPIVLEEINKKECSI